jgi:uncharacterized protein YajQ (UPF0234 family)
MAIEDLTVPQGGFCIDGIPPKIEKYLLNGKNGNPEVICKNPSGKETYELVVEIIAPSFNGTSIVTLSAFDPDYEDLNLDKIPKEKLRKATLVILDLEENKEYGEKEIQNLVSESKYDLNYIKECVVFFRTKLMSKVLETVDENGIPNYEELEKNQKNRPSISVEGAKEIHKLIKGIKGFVVDNISMESVDRKGLAATQALMNAHKDEDGNCSSSFIVYNTKTPIDEDNVEITIEIGNQPRGLPGCPVSVYLSKK